MTAAWVLLGVFVLVAYTVEAVTGFGSIVIALSLGALVLPIADMLPVLVPLNIALSGYLTLRHYQRIHWPTLLQLILPLMAAGTLVGYLLKPQLGSTAMQLLFGVLVIWFSARELRRLFGTGQARVAHSRGKTLGLMFGAGATHGLFASGGPLLVYALAGRELDKRQMRSTLIAVWLSLNTLLTMIFLADGTLVPALPVTAAYLPVVGVGIVAGEWLHHHIDELQFRKLVFLLLAGTGVALTVSAW
ncbi:sulfite exporter TauE/SafE family protein [Ectothiorhodospiraceae bacterium WFHF3C12]|nr:sulfite exporter TauE/SafE family protein [Ectothiorhodospiraceae bacterium WFHF3C12]